MQVKLAPAYNRSPSERASISHLVRALKQCGKLRDLKNGKKLHREAVAYEFHSDKYVASALITMYSRCRDVKLARQVFDEMVNRDVVAWTSLILGYVGNGEWLGALALFTSMECEPDSVMYMAVLKACAGFATEREAEKRSCLEKGVGIHDQVKARGMNSQVPLANSLIDMYAKCGCMQGAKNVFDGMSSRDVVSWTSLILGYVTNGECSVALSVFTCMDCEPNSVTYVAVLKACGGLAGGNESDKQLCLQKGISLHKQIKDRGYESDDAVANTLISMYSRCGSLECARQVFRDLKQKNVIAWTTLITGYVENGEGLTALILFASMDCQPDKFTYAAAVKACGLASQNESEKSSLLENGIAIHKQARDKGLESDVVLANSLIFMYGKCGSIKRAKEVFDRMQSRDVVTLNSMISAYMENGMNSEAMEMFERMDRDPSSVTYVAALKACGGLASENVSENLTRGVRIHEQLKARGVDSDLVVSTSLLDMYTKCGSMTLARKVFDGMKKRSVITWTALISGYVENNKSMVALELYQSMDCQPNSYTYMAVLKACGNVAAVRVGQQVHARLCRLGVEQDDVVVVTLMDFYRKVVRMNRAQELFNCMHSPSVVAWTSLVTGYCSLGNSFQVFSLAKLMEESGVEMDEVAFTCILTACSHAGLVEVGKVYFGFMLKCGIGLNMKHYSCMVDMLGRANRLEDALALMDGVPGQAKEVAWMSLLGSCKKWKNLEVGKAAFDALMNVETDKAAAFVLMSDIYASS